MLAFLRKLDDETVLVVANLSRFVQYVELDLSAYAGHVPIELFGGTRLPPIGKTPYLLTLGPHTFLWFHLSAAAATASCPPATGDLASLPVVPARQGVASPAQDEEELEVALSRYLSCQALPTSGEPAVKATHLRDSVPLTITGRTGSWVVLDGELQGGETGAYALPVLVATDDTEFVRTQPATAIARVDGQGGGVLYDASTDPDFCRALLDMIDGERRLPSQRGAELAGRRFVPLFAAEEGRESLSINPLKATPPNALLNLGNRFVLKVFRRVEEGLHPEVEIGRFLRRSKLPCPVAPLVGAVELPHRRASPMMLAVLHQFVPNEGDAWQYAPRFAQRFLRASRHHRRLGRGAPAARLADRASRAGAGSIGRAVGRVSPFGSTAGASHGRAAPGFGERSRRPAIRPRAVHSLPSTLDLSVAPRIDAAVARRLAPLLARVA